jgi:hypothetical protein
MSVYKEGYYAIKEITNHSTQIFSDACDYGAPIKKNNTLWNLVKQLVDQYKVDGTRESGEWGVSNVVELMDEWGGGVIERFKITYCVTNKGRCKGFDGFVSVDKI